MEASDWISLAAVALSIYAIYIGKRSENESRSVEIAQRAGEIHIILVAAQIKLSRASLDLKNVLIEREWVPEENREQINNLIAEMESLENKIYGHLGLREHFGSYPQVKLEKMASLARVIDQRAESLKDVANRMRNT